MADASSSGPQAISGLGEDIGRFVAWKSSPGGLVHTARGPRGERLTLTHDKCGRVVERRVERDGFRAKVWRYEWDAFDRLIRCVTPDREAWRYGYDPFGRRVWKVKEFTEAEARSYVGKFPDLIDAARLPDRGQTLTPPTAYSPYAPANSGPAAARPSGRAACRRRGWSSPIRRSC